MASKKKPDAVAGEKDSNFLLTAAASIRMIAIKVGQEYSDNKNLTDPFRSSQMNTNHVIRSAAIVAALVLSSFGSRVLAAGVIGATPAQLTNSITASMDGGTKKTGDTWYQLGLNTASPSHGIAVGVVAAQYDPLSTYLFQPVNANNALLMNTGAVSGTLTFSRPLSVTALSFSGSTGNGSTAPTVTPTLHFSDGSSDTLTGFKVPDWFGGSPAIQTSNGRFSVTANSFDNEGSGNPRVLALNMTLSPTDANKLITSIDLNFAGAGNNETAIFGVSGDFAGLGHYSPIPLAATSFNQDMIVGISEVPEPSTIALFGLGVAGLVACYRRKKS